MGADRLDTGRRRRAPTVLVVEDDDACSDEVCEVLRSAGYAPLRAADGARALEVLVSGQAPEPVLILLDVGLPVMTGPELVKVLKGYHRLARIPVILMSANSTRPAVDGSELGWLPKPFTAEALLSEVEKRCRDEGSPFPSGMTG